MEKNSKISVIIPTYNNQEYIADTIESVLRNASKNYDLEILVIDDGSTDETYLELKNKKLLDSVIYLEKQNSGVSETRNVGIEKATGDYLFFLDGDDILPLNAMEKLFDTAKHSNADIVKGLLRKTLSKDLIQYNAESTSIIYEKRSRSQVIFEMLETYDYNTACGILWKKTAIKENNVYFNKNLSMAEDLDFILNCLKYNEEIVVLNSVVYLYRINDNSATIGKNAEKYKKFIRDIQYVYKNLYEVNFAVNETKARYKYCKELSRGISKYLGAKNHYSANLNIIMQEQFTKFTEEQFKNLEINIINCRSIDDIFVFLVKKKKYLVLFILSKVIDIKNKKLGI